MPEKKEESIVVDEKKNKETEKIKKKSKEVVEIRARKVRIKKSGIWITKYKDDIIKDPWPELMQAAHLDSKHRVFAIREI